MGIQYHGQVGSRVFTARQTDRQTDGQTDRQTDRQMDRYGHTWASGITDRQRYVLTVRQTDRQTDSQENTSTLTNCQIDRV